jgi:hypothetical protein
VGWSSQAALDIAQKEFAELANVPRDRISFNIVATIKKESHFVRISQTAWSALVMRQQSGGVIDIFVHPDPSLPPTYLSTAMDMMQEHTAQLDAVHT